MMMKAKGNRSIFLLYSVVIKGSLQFNIVRYLFIPNDVVIE